MQTFTGYEYIKIDIANSVGMDKELFETRIKWVDDNANNLMDFAIQAEEPAQFIKAVRAKAAAEAHEPTGFMVGLDACSSGLQIMGAVTGCMITCENTGLINPNERADMYTKAFTAMKAALNSDAEVERADIKEAVMTHFYGSYARPEALFPTPEELSTFYRTMIKVAPGASYLRNILIGTWQPFAMEHSWKLPDGFVVRVPVMSTLDLTVEVDELNHSTFTHRIKVNEGTECGVANAANPIHSIDGMMVREINRRCNYDQTELEDALEALNNAGVVGSPMNRTKFMSLRWASSEFIDNSISTFSMNELQQLRELVIKVLKEKSFPVITIHDAFKCHPNNMNTLRYWYKEILAELADSRIIEDIIEGITGTRPSITRDRLDISKHIRNANYHLS